MSPVIFNMSKLSQITGDNYCIHNRLTFETHAGSDFVKTHQRLYFYQKLCGFSKDCTFMKRFYPSFIESFLTFNSDCGFGLLTCENKNK